MKKIFKLLLLASLLATTGCIKQKNCDCGVSGTFVYLKKPYDAPVECTSKDQRVVAHFYSDDVPDEGIIYITGNVPKEYRTYDTLHVSICSKYICEGKGGVTFGYKVHKLKCIEMED